jgi:type IV pilus assembly protein PilN
MKITLNLASQPYIDLRSVLKRLRIIMLGLALVAIALFFLFNSEQKKAQTATARVDAMHNHVQNLERQQQSYEALMRQPQNAAVLAQSDYLNGLFRQKAFSWTATMTDLEIVLPAGVQVLSLDPAITKSGRVEIHLRVSGARDRAIQLVQNLEKSRHFANTRITGETTAQGSGQNNAVQPVSAETLVNFDILADYRPLTAGELASGKATQEQKSTKNAGKNAGRKPARHRVPAKKQGAR